MDQSFSYIGNAATHAGTALGVALLAGGLWLWCHKTHRRLGAMLSFFAFIIALSVATLSFWHWRRMVPVRITQNELETSYGKVELSNIKSARIEMFRENAPMGLRELSRLLYIEGADGTFHVFSELDYPIDSIKLSLDAAIFKNTK
jgi:hypothetical protein